MVYEMIKHRIKPVLAYKEHSKPEIDLNIFRTIVSVVSSLVGNPEAQLHLI